MSKPILLTDFSIEYNGYEEQDIIAELIRLTDLDEQLEVDNITDPNK